MNINEKIEQAEKLLTELKSELQEQAEPAWPRVGDTYWYVSNYYTCHCDQWDGVGWDTTRSGCGNVFRTREEAWAALQQSLDSHPQWAAQRKVLAALKEAGAVGWVDGDKNWAPQLHLGVLGGIGWGDTRTREKHWYATKEQWLSVIGELGQDVVVLALLGGE